MAKKNTALGHRERQIVESVYRLGEASVGEILAALPDPPTYSTIRAMLAGQRQFESSAIGFTAILVQRI